MAKWYLCKETPPGSGIFPAVSSIPNVTPTVGSVIIDATRGWVVFDDTYPDDFSGWGDDESNVLMNFLWAVSAADSGISYGAMWVGADYVPPEPQPEGFMAAAKKIVVPSVLFLVRSSKVHPRPAKPPHPHHPNH